MIYKANTLRGVVEEIEGPATEEFHFYTEKAARQYLITRLEETIDNWTQIIHYANEEIKRIKEESGRIVKSSHISG